jgi:hypothetical protein
MKKNIVLILAGLFLTPLLAGQALAHGAPFPHYHKAKKRHHKMKKYRSYRSKRTVVVRPARKIVIHESGPRTVVIKERPTRVVVKVGLVPSLFARRHAP